MGPVLEGVVSSIISDETGPFSVSIDPEKWHSHHRFSEGDTPTMTRSQCGGCHEVFNSVAAFDLHRVGDFDKRTRRCLTPQEMSAKGMTRNDKGWWTLPVTDTVAPWYAALKAPVSRSQLHHEAVKQAPQRRSARRKA